VGAVEVVAGGGKARPRTGRRAGRARSPILAPMSQKDTDRERFSIRETLTSIIIAFALAFVFRAFVIEAFVIPTGSMAPTLMGAHMRLRSEQSGYEWPVNPRGDGRPAQVNDPMTGWPVPVPAARPRSGDRILVLKYLYAMREPERFDLVVFKDPGQPRQNFIKRLIGLPGEEVALVDGDVFYREGTEGQRDRGTEGADWREPGWRIARKSERVQREVWQAVFCSSHAPLDPAHPDIPGRDWFRPPWRGSTGGWQIGAQTVYTYDRSGPTAMEWDTDVRRVDDRYPYNQLIERQTGQVQYGWPTGPAFPVGDVRLRCGIEAGAEGLSAAAIVHTRGHEFRARIEGGEAFLERRPVTPGEPDRAPLDRGDGWETLARGTIGAQLAPGRVVNVEFWHVDQSLWLFIDGRRVAHAEYDWTPARRIEHAVGLTLEQALASESGGNIFETPELYRTGPTLPRWEFSGPVTLHRVGLCRDVFYRATTYGQGPLAGRPGLGTHPDNTARLDGDQYYVCGDNSPASSDGRMWQNVDPWAATVDPTPGVVHRDMMLGRAFFVYFPSLIRDRGVPMVDFGRLRFIW
jgi:signal peptidase I